MTLGLRATIAAYLIVMLVPLTAHAWDRGDVDTFATLPPGERHPEGIAADSTGNLYVTTFDVTHGGRPGQLLVLGVAGSSNLLLGLDFHPTTHELLVIDFGSANVRRVDPFTGTSSVFMTVTGSPPIRRTRLSSSTPRVAPSPSSGTSTGSTRKAGRSDCCSRPLPCAPAS